jgi:hypothetical protein
MTADVQMKETEPQPAAPPPAAPALSTLQRKLPPPPALRNPSLPPEFPGFGVADAAACSQI